MNWKDKVFWSIPVCLLFLGVLIVVYSVDFFVESSVIKNNLIWIVPVFLAINFLLLVFSFVWSLKDLRRLFRKVDRKTWVFLLVIFVLGFSLRTFVAPHTDRVFFDEDIYLNIGQNIARDGKAVLCNYGTQETCIDGVYNKQPNGYPFLMGVLFFLFGTSEVSAHYANAVLGGLSVLLVFLIAYLFFENKKIGLLSALIFALIPVAIRWSPTTAAGTAFVFFTGLTVFAFLSYLKDGSRKLFLLGMFSLVFTIQIRTEGVLLFFVVLLMFLFFKKSIFDVIKDRKNLLILVVFVFLLVPHLIHLNTMRSESWGTEDKALGFKYVDENFEDNGMFFFKNSRFPVVFTLFSLIGLCSFSKSDFKRKLVLAVWFLCFFGLYLLFYAGSFNYGTDVRFSLNLYMPVAILGGCGGYIVSSNLKKRLFKRRYISVVLVAAVILVSFYPFVGMVSSVEDSAWDARFPHDFLVEEMKELPDDCWIFTQVPSLVLVHGKNGLQSWYAQNPEVVDRVFNSSDYVFYYEGYWCHSEPWKSGQCQYFHDEFDLQVFDSASKRYRTCTLYYVKRKD